MCLFIKLNILERSGPVLLLVILCYSHLPSGGSIIVMRTSDGTRQRRGTLCTSPVCFLIVVLLVWVGTYGIDMISWRSLFLQLNPLPFFVSPLQRFGGFSRTSPPASHFLFFLLPSFPPLLVGYDPLIMRRARYGTRSHGRCTVDARRARPLSNVFHSISMM